MRLRQLRVCGFKSFADRTEFDFRDGVTVIVGPNGCGKSNVVDAVRWTLGEQSAKSLRGKEMMDVVFNGASGRKPAAFAETSLVFENDRGLLPGGLASVEVTRRLYRSGESEYILNKTASRLKDVKDLFMGTGVGVDAYSVIGQGKVEHLLAGNPQERRLVFEEAAGISRYKAKKKEALRKLEKVQSNLARLADVTEELDRRLRSLKVQAGKARNYRDYAARLKELRVRHSLAEYHRLRTDGGGSGEALAELREKRDAAAAGHAAAEAARAALAEELSAREAAESEWRVASARLRAGIAAAEDRLTGARRRLDEALSETARDRAALADGRRRCADLLARSGGGADERARLDERVADSEARLASAQAEAAALRAEIAELAARLEAARGEVVEWARRSAQVSNERSALSVHQRNLAANRGKLAARAETLRTEIADLRAQREAPAAAVARLEETIARCDAERLAAKAQAEGVAGRLADANNDLESARKELGKLESRHAVLTEMESRLEGVDAGVREVIARAKAERGYGSVRGMLADFLRAPTNFIPVIEAALGRHLQSLVASAGDRLMTDLNRTGPLPGSARFFCLDRLPTVHDGLRLDGEPEYVGRPMDFVEVHPVARPVAENLLARTIVVRSVRGAMRLRPKVPAGYRFVTLDGQVVGEDGSLELGSAADRDRDRGGLLHRKSELARLNAEIAARRARVTELEAGVRDADENGRHLEKLQQDLRTAIYEAAAARAEKQSQIERIDAALSRAAGEEPGLLAEIDALDSDLQEVDRQAAEMDLRAGELDAGRTDAERRIAEDEARLTAAREAEAAAAARVGDLRVELSADRQRREGFDRQSAQMEAARKQAEDSLEAAAVRVARGMLRIAEAEREALSSESERALLHWKLEQAQREAVARGGGPSNLPGRVAEMTARVRALAAESAELTERLHKLELAGSEKEVRIAALISRVRDDYGLDLVAEYGRLKAEEERARMPAESAPAEVASDAAASELPLFDAPAQAPTDAPAEPAEPAETAETAEPAETPPPPTAAPASPAAVAAVSASSIFEPTEADWAKVQEEINELKSKIDRLGNVNLDSIAELEEAESRAGKMQSQVADLNDARKQLEDLIDRINAESAVLFVNTFAEVRKNFQELFRKLFGGGKADVFLENESDPLECGIEIIARPPGKEPRSITLLSGGEKTMTAVAMLLAVFRSKPSPFCILDEVDAALDEANTHRFGAVLKEFTDKSQFIVISHRKPTMSVADVMYGVTMQETGVSKKVAVRFNDHGDIIATDDAGAETTMNLK